MVVGAVRAPPPRSGRGARSAPGHRLPQASGKGGRGVKDGYIEIKPGAIIEDKAGRRLVSRGGRWRPYGGDFWDGRRPARGTAGRPDRGAGLSRETKAELLGVKI